MTALDPRRGCTPFDIGLAMDRYWPDMDKIVRVTELVRRNLHHIDTRLPSDTRAWLMKGRTSAHGEGDGHPIIAIVFVSDPSPEWSFIDTNDKIGKWLSERALEIDFLIQDIACPGWQELRQGLVFPPVEP